MGRGHAGQTHLQFSAAATSESAATPRSSRVLHRKSPGPVQNRWRDVGRHKCAGGWYKNLENNLPASVGLMLVFDQLTGLPMALLQDGGYLTDLRTALAACVTARCLAPANPRAVGLVGAGTICRVLLETMAAVLPPQCKRLHVWARRPEAAAAFVDTANAGGAWNASTAASLGDVVRDCDVIFTCTPSKGPLLLASHLSARPPDAPGLHICVRWVRIKRANRSSSRHCLARRTFSWRILSSNALASAS